jgi:hypothetical protein
MLNEMIQQFLPFPLRSHLEQQIIELSGQVATIEAQMRKSGDNFRHIFAKVILVNLLINTLIIFL